MHSSIFILAPLKIHGLAQVRHDTIARRKRKQAFWSLLGDIECERLKDVLMHGIRFLDGPCCRRAAREAQHFVCCRLMAWAGSLRSHALRLDRLLCSPGLRSKFEMNGKRHACPQPFIYSSRLRLHKPRHTHRASQIRSPLL